MNKKEAKRLAISFVIVLVVNVLILAIVNSFQIAYWENAPEEEIVYNMVAGENEKGLEYLYKDTNFNIDDDDVIRIERIFKDSSAIKLSKKESYKMLYLLNEKSFAFYVVIPDRYKSDGIFESIKEPISELWVYVYDGSVYIVRSTDERQTNTDKRLFAVYKAEDNTELYDELNQWVDPSGDGIFYCTIPDWFNRVRNSVGIHIHIPMMWDLYGVFLLLRSRERKKQKSM